MFYLTPFPSYHCILVKLRLFTGVPLFNSLVQGEPLNSGVQTIREVVISQPVLHIIPLHKCASLKTTLTASQQKLRVFMRTFLAILSRAAFESPMPGRSTKTAPLLHALQRGIRTRTCFTIGQKSPPLPTSHASMY